MSRDPRDVLADLTAVCRSQLDLLAQGDLDRSLDLDAERQHLLSCLPARLPADCLAAVQDLKGLTDALEAMTAERLRATREQLTQAAGSQRAARAYDSTASATGAFSEHG